jgi:Protein of unknown function (DUF4232)
MKKWQILNGLFVVSTIALLTQGCTRGHYHAAAGTVTPGLTAEDRRHGRNGTNPNAPFTLINREQRGAASKLSTVPLNATSCAPEDLGVVEVAEQVNGEERFVSLAFVNEGPKECELGGYPTVSLLDEHGEAIGSLSVVEVGDKSQTTPSPTAVEAALPTGAGGPIEVMLAPQGEAYFGISWMAGAQCPSVSGLTVRAPGIARSFSINHRLSVCSGQVRVTALRSTQNSG